MAWWHELYDDWLAAAYFDDDPQAPQLARAIAAMAQLAPGNHVLDQCCGVGRLSMPLSQLGYRVTAVDQAASYIARARAQDKHAAIDYHAADAQQFVTQTPVDAVINWWTSFGYFAADDDNLKMLCCAERSLKPSGVMLLDTMNAPHILRHFRPLDEQLFDKDGQPIKLTRHSRLSLSDGMLEKRWVYQAASGAEQIRHSRVRLYHPHELVTLFERAGFTAIELMASSAGDALSLDSPRCIVRARKPR